MRGRASTMMTQKLKDEKPLYTHLAENVWIIRGTLPFPQGVDYIYKLFAGKPVAEVYNHRFLLDKENWPDQPSPQLHLTEELQSIMRLVRGTGAKDRFSGLDNTMTLVRSPQASDKRFLMYNPIETDKKTTEYLNTLLDGHEVSDIVIPSRQTWQSLTPWLEKYPKATVWHSGNVPLEKLEEYPDTKLHHMRTAAKIDFEPNASPIFPDVNLFRIHGDDVTNEHVLYHGPSGVLSCTDLYHGAYTDFDPCNTWLARFWFKCQRLGDYKSKIYMPQFRKTQIETKGSRILMQETVDVMTQVLPIEHLVFSHGTPPVSGPDAVIYLRSQYAL